MKFAFCELGGGGLGAPSEYFCASTTTLSIYSIALLDSNLENAALGGRKGALDHLGS